MVLFASLLKGFSSFFLRRGSLHNLSEVLREITEVSVPFSSEEDRYEFEDEIIVKQGNVSVPFSSEEDRYEVFESLKEDTETYSVSVPFSSEEDRYKELKK